MNQCENQVQNTEWEGRKGEQSPDGNVLEFPVRRVEDLYNTVCPPVETIVVPYLSPKIGPGPLGMPVPRPHIVSVRGKAERWSSFSWAFIAVEGGNEGQYLLVAAGRTKAVIVMTVVLGCFAASTAPFILKF